MIDKVGQLGKKLHTGRSRNDQVATDLKLWCKDTVVELLSANRPVSYTHLDVYKRQLEFSSRIRKACLSASDQLS